MTEQLLEIYERLMNLYGPQGWWPLMRQQPDGSWFSWYHKGDYTFPHTQEQIFEICLGAILTQNTNWQNVVKALTNLLRANALTPQVIEQLPHQELAQLIRPAGYFNQKATYLKTFANFFLSLKGDVPTRNQLLEVRGIGRETADSMLLYAWKQPHFVVDAYTRRMFQALGLIEPKWSYDRIKAFFEQNLPPDLALYQEYHALIVEHAKQKNGFRNGQKPF